MDYKKKYLKYKLKYLQAKNNLKGGMQAADRISVSDVNTEETKCVFFDPNNNIFESVAEAFNRPINHIDEVGWIGGPGGRFDSEWTFSDVKIEDGARLSVSFKTTIDEIIDDIIKLNPHLTRDDLISLIDVYESDGPSHYHSIWWPDLDIKCLPDSIGALIVDGDMSLENNKLTTLPENFSKLTVGNWLDLDNNNLETLPESFGSLKVSDLNLCNNNLVTLPESFGDLVSKNVDLRGNPVSASQPQFDGMNLVLE